jgi:hypothetical protein
VARKLDTYGFAFLVLAALACASFLAGSANVPSPVPDCALQAPEVYRLEIGAAFFVAFYLAVLAVVLALEGKGFSEFGTRGLKVETVVDRKGSGDHQQILMRQLEIDRRADKKLQELRCDVKDLQDKLASQNHPPEQPPESH